MKNHELSKIKESLKELRINLINFYNKFVPLKVVEHINDLFSNNKDETEKWITIFTSFKSTGMTFFYLEKIIEDYEKAENYTEFQYAMFNEWIINNTYSFLLNIAIELNFFETIYLDEKSKKIDLNTLSKILKTNIDYFDKYFHLFFKGFYEDYIAKLIFARNVLQHPLNVYENNFKKIFQNIEKPVLFSIDRISASLRYVGCPENYRENYCILFSIVKTTNNIVHKKHIKINVFELLLKVITFINLVIKDFYSNFQIN